MCVQQCRPERLYRRRWPECSFRTGIGPEGLWPVAVFGRRCCLDGAADRRCLCGQVRLQVPPRHPTRCRGWRPQHNGGGNGEVDFTIGHGDLANDGYNVMATASYTKQQELRATQRDFSAAGFYPAGGRRFCAEIHPAKALNGIQIGERGEITSRRATAVVANLPRHIAQREVETVGKMLNWGPEQFSVQESRNSAGPGNIVMIEIGSSEVTEIFSAFGQVALAAEKVASIAAREARGYLVQDMVSSGFLKSLAYTQGVVPTSRETPRHNPCRRPVLTDGLRAVGSSWTSRTRAIRTLYYKVESKLSIYCFDRLFSPLSA